MNDRLSNIGGTLIALAFSESLGFATRQEPKIDLDSIEKDFAIQPANEEQLFIPKETAYERRNRGQKWYRKFNHRKHK